MKINWRRLAAGAILGAIVIIVGAAVPTQNYYAPNQGAIYLSQNCGSQANCYQVHANVQANFDCTITVGPPTTVNCPDNNFVAGDVGKNAEATCCIAWGSAGSLVVIGASATTITAVNSNHNVTVSTTATGAGTGGSVIFIWANDDTTQANAGCQALNVAANSAASALYLPATMMWVASAPCVMTATHAFSLAIKGAGPTSGFFAAKYFNFSSCGSIGCIIEDNGGGLNSPLNDPDVFEDFTVWGGGDGGNGESGHNDKGIISTPALTTIRNVNLIGWEWHYDGGTQLFYGIYAGAYTEVYSSEVNGAGTVNCAFNGAFSDAAQWTQLNGTFCGAGQLYPCYFTGSVATHNSNCYGGNSTNGIAVYMHTSTANWYSDTDTIAGQIYADAGTARISRMSQYGTSAANGAIWNVGGIFYLRDSYITDSGGGKSIYQTSGIIFDEGGNLLPQGTTISGNAYIGEATSANQTLVTATNLVLSAGWGSTAAWTALSGGDFPITGTITNSGTGQGASPTITYTFPTPLPVAPISCTATDLSGTNPLLNPFTTSSLSTTGVTFTATGTPTVSDTEVMQITCTTI